MGLDPSNKSRLTERELPQFTGETLFDHLARAVCQAWLEVDTGTMLRPRRFQAID
jgi:hypothetical protein